MTAGVEKLLHGVSWKRSLVLLVLVLGWLMVEPHLYLVRSYPLVLVAVAGIGGFLARRSHLDGALYLAAHLIAQYGVESVAGPQALACLSFGLLALTGRPRFALLTGSALLALLMFSVRLKYDFGGSALTWQDLRYFFMQFGDNVGVMASQPTVVAYGTAAILAFACATAVLWKYDGNGVTPGTAHTRLYFMRVVPVLLAFWCGSALETAAKRLSDRSPFSLSEAAEPMPVSKFLSTLYLEPKANYHRVDTAQFKRDAQALALRVGAAKQPADMVLFLQESQLNTRAIGGCPESMCEFQVFGAPQGTTDHGELRVHTYGGGTWLSEFAVNNGLPHRVFGPAGEFASFNVAPGVNRSFIRSLKAAGYHTVAVYPVRGGMMNARLAYRSYGFDEFYDSGDLGLSGRYDTPDSSIHEAAVKVLNSARKLGKPVFVMAVTIFNHSQHGVGMERVPSDMLMTARKVFDESAEADNLADYVWRTGEFDKTYLRTRAAVLGSDRPAVLAWFGDHQPPFPNAPKLRHSIKTLGQGPAVPGGHLTWYNIAANVRYEGADLRPRRLDIVFLPGLLAQRAGAPLDDWLAANALARERCGGLLVECPQVGWRDAYLTHLLGDLRSIR
jgi:hypothetical protein